MKESQSEIMKELHFLLKTKTPEEFLAASKQRGISTYLKSALEYLALECLSKPSKRNLYEDDLYSRHRPYKLVTKRKDLTQRHYKSLGKSEIEQIYEIIVNSKRFSRKAAIINFARRFGLPFPFNSKDSRSRTAKKLTKAIFSSSKKKQEQILNVLFEGVGRQTQGWLDIIKTD